MNPSVMFVITSDPRNDPRPAEAIRIAAGVGVWKKVNVTVYLSGASALLLSEDVDGLVDQDNFTRYLPIIHEFGRPIFVQRGAPFLNQIGQSPVKYQEISEPELAALSAQKNYLIRF